MCYMQEMLLLTVVHKQYNFGSSITISLLIAEGNKKKVLGGSMQTNSISKQLLYNQKYKVAINLLRKSEHA